jgi:hypothetical protein
MVSELVKQAKVQSSQDNRRNMVNTFEKRSATIKRVFQQSYKPQLHKKQQKANKDEKIKYARSVYLNARRSHIKNNIGYKAGDKHNCQACVTPIEAAQITIVSLSKPFPFQSDAFL